MNFDHVGERIIFNPFSHVQKWQSGKRNFSIGGTVLVLQDERVRNQWPIAMVIQVFKDSNGHV